MFNHENIRNYAELMKELDLSALEITEGDKKLRLERTVAQPVQTIAVPASAPAVMPVSAPAAADTAHSASPGKAVTSPMVGVFYRAPAENAEPFVKVGDTVRKGDVVGIIEAMKLMNEIGAEQMGTIREVCLEDATPVEFGTVLFYIEPHNANDATGPENA